jgi:hypothetical protein
MKIIGGILGLILGGIIGIGSGYAVAELLGISSRETQAYFQVFVAMPVGALVGLLTGAATLGLISADRKLPLLLVSLIGSALLLGALVMGLRWSSPERPAEVRVRNETSAALEQTYLGHDFRRATSLGTVAPGTTTAFHEVDLAERGSFNAVRGQRAGATFQLTLELDQQTSLQAGRYTYVVRERDGQLELELQPED